jgi:hypothetical protein
VLLGSWSFVQLSFHMALLNFPRLVSVEIAVRGRNLVGILEEASRETQLAAKSFVPTNACLFVERLLDQQLCTS